MSSTCERGFEHPGASASLPGALGSLSHICRYLVGGQLN
jgi:hypothetical protein